MSIINTIIAQSNLANLNKLLADTSMDHFPYIKEKAKEVRQSKLLKAAKNAAFENLLPVEIICALAKRCTGTMAIANAIKSGNMVVIDVYDHATGNKALKRWAGHFTVAIDNGEIVTNTLSERAWSLDEEEAKKEADNAILYFARQWANNPFSLNITLVNR